MANENEHHGATAVPARWRRWPWWHRQTTTTRRIIRTALTLLVTGVLSGVLGIFTASADSSLGPHAARYSVTAGHEITVDLGPLGSVLLDSPLPWPLGVEVVVQEIPLELAAVPASPVTGLASDLSAYAQVLSHPEAVVADAATAVVRDAVGRAVLVWSGTLVLIAGARLASRGLLRREVAKAARRPGVLPLAGVLVGALVAVPALGAVGGRQVEGTTIGALAGTPLEELRMTGRMAQLIDTYGGYLVDAYEENEAFYTSVSESLEAAYAADRAPLRPPGIPIVSPMPVDPEATEVPAPDASVDPQEGAGPPEDADGGQAGDGAPPAGEDADGAGPIAAAAPPPGSDADIAEPGGEVTADGGADGGQAGDGMPPAGEDADGGPVTAVAQSPGSGGEPLPGSGDVMPRIDDGVGAGRGGGTFPRGQEARAAGVTPSPTPAPPARVEPVTLLLVSDLHCNVGMAPVITTALRLSQAEVLLDGGDTVMSGTSVESYCVNAFAGEIPEDIPVVVATGNHDSVTTAEQMRDAGYTVLGGDVVEVAGIHLLGDTDPTLTAVGEGTAPERDETIPDMGERLAEDACAANRVDLMLVHNPRAALPALEEGCVPLSLSGHWHRRVGPEVAGEGVRYVSSSTAGASGGATIGPLHGPAEMTVLRVDAASGRPLDYRVITIATDTTVDLGRWYSFPDPAADPTTGDTGARGSTESPADAAAPRPAGTEPR